MDNTEQKDNTLNDGKIPGRNGGELTPFKPGQSGNPAGLKKGTKHLTTILRALLDEQISVTINNQNFVMTRGEALMLEKVRLATTSPFDAVRLRAIMDIEDRLVGRPVPVQTTPDSNPDEVVVFYIPNQNSRKRLPSQSE